MRHRKGNRKLSKPTDQRKALLKSLACALFKYKRIETTLPRAKEASKLVDEVITLAKRGNLSARRRAYALLGSKKIANDIFTDAQEKFGKKAGGYTRAIKAGWRRGDSAPRAVLEIIS